MLTLKASSLRATLNDTPANPATSSDAAARARDPAGFASLLRQTRTPPFAAPLPLPPAPQAAITPERGPACHAPAPVADKAHATDSDASDEANTDAASASADDTDASTESDPTNRTRALLKPKLRGTDITGHGARGLKPATEAAGAGGDAAAVSASDARDGVTTHAAPANGSVPLDPSIQHWLAGLQRGATPALTGSGAGDSAAKASFGTAAEALETHQLAQDPRATEPQADARKDRAASNQERPDAAPIVAALLAEQRASEPAPRLDALSSFKDMAAAAAAAFAPPAIAAREATAPVAVSLATPVNAPDFAQALGLQMSVFARDGIQQAELHLNPAEMGPVSVQIVMDGTQARVDFGADLAATRQAIEAGLPELASALRDAGFTLAGGGVSQHSGGRSNGDGAGTNDGRGSRAAQRLASVDTVAAVSGAVRRIVTAGGVDLYA